MSVESERRVYDVDTETPVKRAMMLSGREPLFQLVSTRRVLSEVHAVGIHTAIDTSGFLRSRLSDEDTYREAAGQSLQPTIDFSDRLTALRTSSPAGQTCSGSRSSPSTARVPTSGIRYSLERARPPTAASLKAARQVFRDRGILTF